MSISEIAFCRRLSRIPVISVNVFVKKYDQTPREYMNEWRKS